MFDVGVLPLLIVCRWFVCVVFVYVFFFSFCFVVHCRLSFVVVRFGGGGVRRVLLVVWCVFFVCYAVFASVFRPLLVGVVCSVLLCDLGVVCVLRFVVGLVVRCCLSWYSVGCWS